jgi:hypothetical protein
MNFWEFLSSLAWPGLALYAFICLRGKINFKDLSQFIQKIKYKDVEVSFHKDEKKVERNALALDKTPELSSSIEEKLKNVLSVDPEQSIRRIWEVVQQTSQEKLLELKPDYVKSDTPVPSHELGHTGGLTPKLKSTLESMDRFVSNLVYVEAREIQELTVNNFLEAAKKVCAHIYAIKSLPSVNLTAFTLIISETTILLDHEKHISLEEMKEAIQQKKSLQLLADNQHTWFIKELIKHSAYPGFYDYFNEKILEQLEIYDGRELRKLCIENNGWALMGQYVSKIISQGSGWHPEEVFKDD